MDNIASLAPIIISSAVAIFSFIQWYGGRGQRDATEASTLTGSALELVKALRVEVDELREDVSQLEANEKTLKATIESQGAVIVQLRETVEKQAIRIETLENENGRLQAENHKLKSGRGGKI